MLGGWTQRDAERIERDYGFADWEAPDAGENAKAANFGGGNAGDGEGWDEVYTRQVESWLAGRDSPRAVLPRRLARQPSRRARLSRLSTWTAATRTTSSATSACCCRRPSTRSSTGKPSVHSLMRMGMTAYLGPLDSRRKQLDYVNFYAHLHRLVDEKIGRILAALGDPDDPGSLRSRTVIVRCRRPRRDGPLARRPPAEGVQRLRGDDQRPAGRLQPGALPEAGRDRCARLAGRRPADDPRSRRAARRRRQRGPGAARAQPGADPGGEGRTRARARRALAGRPRAGARARRPGRDRPGRRSTSPTTTTRRRRR